MDAELALHRLGGVAEAGDLRRWGVRARDLREAVEAGAIRRVRRGCYALPGADPVATAEIAWRGRATCVSAARTWALPLLDPPQGLHLAVPRGRSCGREHLRPPAGTVLHHVDDPAAAASVAGALDVAARCTSRESQLVLVDAARARGLLTSRELEAFAIGSRRRREFLIRHSTALAQSPLETLTRIGLRRARLAFEEQVELPGVGRVDFLVEGRLIVELDGRQFHDNPAQFAEDRRRDRAAAALGYRTVRFTYADVVGHPDGVIADVVAALRAPWR